jgi:chromosome segregation ATPase
MQVRRLEEKLKTAKSDLDKANKRNDNATQSIVKLETEVVTSINNMNLARHDLEAYTGVGDRLELTSEALIDTRDEMCFAKEEIKSRDETTTMIRDELNKAKRLKNHTYGARDCVHDCLLKATNTIRSKAKYHDDSIVGSMLQSAVSTEQYKTCP